MEFEPYPNSLDGSAKPDDETLKRFGFLDVNITLANIVAAL